MKQTFPIRIAGVFGFILTLTCLFFFLKRVDVSLIYYWQQSIPLPIGESLRYPGGISDHLGDWFIEFMTLPFGGSIAVALLVSIVFFSLQLLFRRAKSNLLFHPLVLAALIPFIHNVVIANTFGLAADQIVLV